MHVFLRERIVSYRVVKAKEEMRKCAVENLGLTQLGK